MATHDVSALERVRQTARLLRSEGRNGVERRVRTRLARAVAPSADGHLPVAMEDLRGAGRVLAAGGPPGPLPWTPGEPLKVAFVDEPPSRGSGGQTTIYRMVEHLERRGCDVSVHLIDRHGWHIDQHRRTIRSAWPGVRAEVTDVADGIRDSHAVLATCWESAYPVLASPAAGRRMYFVQDYEPEFHPAGSLSMLAAATYEFGFHGITAGRWLVDKLDREHRMPAEHFDFGCDLAEYHLDDSPGARSARTGVAYYCRPSTPRRAHELAMAALEIFAATHPHVDIHFYGHLVADVPFAVTQHGMLSPTELGQLYNRCIAGLVLSATNVSLVPLEMLGSGCVPVVNDAEHTRLVLANDEVEWSTATPWALAESLTALVDAPPAVREARARAAAASVEDASWERAGDQVLAAIRSAVRSALEPSAHDAG